MKRNSKNKYTSVKKREKKRRMKNYKLPSKRSLLKRIKIVLIINIWINLIIVWAKMESYFQVQEHQQASFE
jgi:uncharacterized ion transporter superfamily protein YfcC